MENYEISFEINCELQSEFLWSFLLWVLNLKYAMQHLENQSNATRGQYIVMPVQIESQKNNTSDYIWVIQMN